MDRGRQGRAHHGGHTKGLVNASFSSLLRTLYSACKQLDFYKNEYVH